MQGKKMKKDNFQSELQQVDMDRQNIIIMGDLNGRVGGMNSVEETW